MLKIRNSLLRLFLTTQFMGGQAVIEGVMMRGPSKWAVVCRRPDGEIETYTQEIDSKKSFLKKILILRGFIALIESMKIGYKALMWSSEIALDEEEKKESENSSSFWSNLFNTLIIIFSIVLFLGLFTVIPVWASNFIKNLFNFGSLGFHVTEVIMRLVMFVGYILLVGITKDMKRVFQYHGAEHKSIAAYENGVVLTPKAAQQFNTAHVRCGTNFLLIVMLLSQIVYSILGSIFTNMNFFELLVSRLLLIPFIAGVSYELLKLAAPHMDKIFVRKIMWPGLKLQKLTTREPDDSQVEIALYSLRAAMEEEQIIEVDSRSKEKISSSWQLNY